VAFEDEMWQRNDLDYFYVAFYHFLELYSPIPLYEKEQSRYYAICLLLCSRRKKVMRVQNNIRVRK